MFGINMLNWSLGKNSAGPRRNLGQKYFIYDIKYRKRGNK